MFHQRPASSLRPLAVALAAAVLWSCTDTADPDPLVGPEVPDLTATAEPIGLSIAAAARDRHTATLQAIEGVVGSGIGIDRDGHHEIRVYTVRSGIPGVPRRLDDVRVVPVVTGRIMAGDANNPTTRERPAPNGFSVGHPDITAGTMGAIVENSAGSRFILSNNHVLANSNDASIGDATLQPGPADGGTGTDQIGTLAAFQPINFSGTNVIDAAIAAVSGTDITAVTPASAYGAPGTTTRSVSVGMSVQKFGRTTRHTTGTVAETNVTVDVCYKARGPFGCAKLARFVNQFTVSDGSFSAGGDSGSLIVTNDNGKNPVGLLFAGSSTRTIANPIDAALNAFDVTITTDPGSGTGNSLPTARFSFTCTDLTCSFDANASSDDDGTIDSWDWNFGDQDTGSGAATSHTYGAAGSYDVTLTVTDDAGALDSDVQTVTVAGPSGGFTLSTTGYKVKGRQKADLSWSGASGASVDVYRDGLLVVTTSNDGSHTDAIDARGNGSYVYQVCEAVSSTCSNTSTVAF